LAEGDSADASGSRFTCEGEGTSKAEALASAEGVCTDKLCRVCGVEIESIVQTTETLHGVAMQRKVVERCRQFRKSPLEVERENVDCGKGKCSVRLEVFFSKDAEQRECSAYASEKFDDPAECEQLIQQFRYFQGRDGQSFRERTQLLDRASAA